eukprot:EC726205.1.p2 GENE.EC726205.1~~EC726205.1.p2  ORF type:complete len:65 (+),score=2.34 EC726205.1:222-416(+)
MNYSYRRQTTLLMFFKRNSKHLVRHRCLAHNLNRVLQMVGFLGGPTQLPHFLCRAFSVNISCPE